MLEELIGEMFTGCHACQGSGLKSDEEQQHFIDEKDPCSYCDGTGEVLSYEAEKLIYIIKKGEKP